jgi:hypothetical protein
VRTAGLQGRRFDRLDPHSSATSAAFTLPLCIRRRIASVFEHDAPAGIAAAIRSGVSDDLLVRDDTRGWSSASRSRTAAQGPR